MTHHHSEEKIDLSNRFSAARSGKMPAAKTLRGRIHANQAVQKKSKASRAHYAAQATESSTDQWIS